MTQTCIITDDEPIALEILEDYIRMVPGLQLAASCTNAMETMAVMQRQKIDLLFLDIRMPGISGLQLLKSMRDPPAVILTTAYPGYAVEGFDLDVVDYLLKPIAVERFLRAVARFRTRCESHAPPGYVYVRSRGEWVKLDLAHIRYIEGLENYVRIYLNDKVLISLSTMKSIEESLPPDTFLRIHRSYIVNLGKVEAVGPRLFRIGKKDIPVGKSYRARVDQRMKDENTVFLR